MNSTLSCRDALKNAWGGHSLEREQPNNREDEERAGGKKGEWGLLFLPPPLLPLLLVCASILAVFQRVRER